MSKIRAVVRWRSRRAEFNARQCCLGLEGMTPSAHLAMKDKPLRNQTSLWTAGSSQKSPLRRCFKSRPLRRAECAGFASGCRSDFLERLSDRELRPSRRLPGLLSGYLPTDTRPQARAKLGKAGDSRFAPGVQAFCAYAGRKNCEYYELLTAGLPKGRSRGAQVAQELWRSCGARPQALPYLFWIAIHSGSPTVRR
jgi:hypothetical protein